jgi:hypothetical protein
VDTLCYGQQYDQLWKYSVTSFKIGAGETDASEGSVLPTMTLSGWCLQSAVGAPAGLCEAWKAVEFLRNSINTNTLKTKNAPSWCKYLLRIIETYTIMVHISSNEDNNASGKSDRFSVVCKSVVMLSGAGAVRAIPLSASGMTLRIISSKQFSCCA